MAGYVRTNETRGTSSKNAYSMDSIHGHFARTIEFLSGSRPYTLRMSKTPDPSLLATLSPDPPWKTRRSMGRRICLAFDPPRLLPSSRGAHRVSIKKFHESSFLEIDSTSAPIFLSLSLSTRWNQRRSMSNGSWSWTRPRRQPAIRSYII